MTQTRHSRTRSVLLALAALCTALALLPSTAAAKEAPPGAWYGWGTKFEVVNGAPKVKFVAYVAEDGTPPRIIASQVTNITSSCVETGNIQYQTETAVFDGASYLACELPSWEEATSELGFDLPDTGECMRCATGGAPVWGDLEVTPAANVSGTMPIIVASDAGVSLFVESTGVTARSRLDIDRVLGGPTTSYRSTSWNIASSPLAHAVVGMEGDGIVAVANHFNWLDYLDDIRWESFFQNQVEGANVGSWEESTNSPERAVGNARNYELGVDGSPLYIGFDPESGDIFEGTLGPGGIEPGCKGL